MEQKTRELFSFFPRSSCIVHPMTLGDLERVRILTEFRRFVKQQQLNE